MIRLLCIHHTTVEDSDNMTSPITFSPQSQQLRLYLATQWRRAFGLNISRLEPLLFIGGQFRSEQWPSLHALGVRAVLSLQAEREDAFVGPQPERTLRLLVPDFHPPTIEQLHQAVAFIEAAHADQLPVFIHCHAGIGRAPLTTAAFLIRRGLSVDEALTTIRQARPIIALNERQIEQLRQWEQTTTRI
jgi:protein-tyrosine phosphatase